MFVSTILVYTRLFSFKTLQTHIQYNNVQTVYYRSLSFITVPYHCLFIWGTFWGI